MTMHGLLQVQQTQALRAEPQVKERIEERVEAAVDVRQARGVRMGQQQKVEKAARGRRQVQVREGVHALENVERGPAESEDHHQRSDDLEEAALLLVFLSQVAEMPGDRAADETVTDGHSQERQQKTQRGGRQAKPRDPQRLVMLIHGDHAEVHRAGGPVAPGVVHRGAEQQGGHGQETRQEPDGSQGCQHGAAGSEPAAGQGVDNGEVAVKTQACQTEDAGVHVDKHNVTADLAESHAERPVVAQRGVHRPQRQRDDERQVRERQVTDVNVRRAPFGFGAPHGEDNHAVTGKTEDENEHVQHGDERVRRLPLRVVAGSLVIFIVIVSVDVFRGWLHLARVVLKRKTHCSCVLIQNARSCFEFSQKLTEFRENVSFLCPNGESAESEVSFSSSLDARINASV